MYAEQVMTRSASRTMRRSTPWMWRWGCLSTQPWWRPCSVACTVTSHGHPKRRASLRAAPATSQSWEWTRSKESESPSAAPAVRMSSFMASTQRTNASRSSLGNSGSRTRWTVTPWRSSTAARRPPPRASTWTSIPARTSPSASLRTWRASPPSTIGGYSHDRIRTRVGTRREDPTGLDGRLHGRRARSCNRPSSPFQQCDAIRRGELGDLGAPRELPQRAREHVAPRSGQLAGELERRPLRRAHRHDDEHLGLTAGKGAHPGPGLDGRVGAGERPRAAGAQGERAPDHEQLERLAVGRGAVTQGGERGTARLPVDGPPIVGVDERERAQLVAVVDVGDPRHRQLEQELAERCALARARDLLREGVEVRAERLVVIERAAERLHRALVRLVGLDPVRRPLRLPQCLLHVGLEPVGLDRPGAHQGLEDEVALGAVRSLELRGQLDPATHARLPRLRHPGQRADARAHVAGALGVVGLRHEQVAREALRALAAARVELLDGDAEAAGIAAHVVEREQARVTVEGRVLDALGHHGRGRLLKARDELGRRVEQPLDPRLGEHLAVLGRRPPVADVGPVHGQRGQRLREVVAVVEAAQALDLGRERGRRLLELRLGRHVAERPRVPRELRPQRAQRRLARGVDEQRGGVVEELVAHRALDGPGAQVLPRVEDLLDPHVADARLAQPLEVAGRVGEPVGMVDAQPVDEAVAHEADRQAVRLLEHLGILLAHAGQVVDVEEAAVAAVLRVEVEELRAQLRVAPVAVGLVRRHVVGDDVEHDPEAGLAGGGDERAELRLAAELLGDAGGIDDVVAVRRPGPRLERGREVDVRGARRGEVGHELARAREPEVAAELEAVGGTQPDRRRRSRVSERYGTTSSSVAATSTEFGAAPGSDVLRTSVHRLPNRRLGSVNLQSSGSALKSSRNDSSRTRSPLSSGAAISSPLRNIPTIRLGDSQSSLVMRWPSVRNHQTSGRPEPSSSLPRRNWRRRNTGWARRRTISFWTNSSRPALRSSRLQSNHEISLSWHQPLLLPCWARPNSPPPSSIEVPCESTSVARKLRCWPSRRALTTGSSVSPSTPQLHERLSSVPSRLPSRLASLCLPL